LLSFLAGGEGACMADDIECINLHDQVGLEAIRSLHKQLDDDDNGNIDLSESDDVSIYTYCCFSVAIIVEFKYLM
jgi:hypothetical protein